VRARGCKWLQVRCVSGLAEREAVATPGQIKPGRRTVVTALGLTQILAWGSSYYLPAVLAEPIAADTGWPLSLVVGGLSLGLLTAGMVSSRAGRTIDRCGGRPVLAFSSAVLATGLALIGTARHPSFYVAGWLIMGIGMGCGLYDASFATLGRLYGEGARRAITSLTLFGGFASTICWPLSAYLAQQLGWRGACLVYAALQLGFALPVHLLALPRVPRASGAIGAGAHAPEGMLPREKLPAFLILAGILTLGAVISSVVSAHLLTVLQARQIDLAGAVALGALIGPAQVSSRIVEMIFGKHYHPIWTMLAATGLIAAGLAVLMTGLPLMGTALILYGAGNGIYSIARGTLPLVLFGPRHYASLMGRLAMPAMLASSLSPSLGAFLLETGGASLTLAILTAAAVFNTSLVMALWMRVFRAPSES
jgi:MFS family permease